ncbi:MAG: cytochrome c oxidase subunit II [Polyangiaceae bacterium]|nr:cytochrome c oxidase subunit II [Polyangiaceae bacterium]
MTCLGSNALDTPGAPATFEPATLATTVAPVPRILASPFEWLPTPGSTSAAHVDWLFNALLVISSVVTLGTVAAVLVFLVRNRNRCRPEEGRLVSAHRNALLEVTWSVIPLGIVVTIFYWGFRGYLDLRTAPQDAIQISATGQEWRWLFTYPNGLTDDALHVPVNTPVRVVLGSQDVPFGLAFPSFRTRTEAVPGRQSDLWFQATQVGKFPILCAEYCGAAHPAARASVVVHEPGGYEKWLETREQQAMRKPPAELGADLFQKHACMTCHSVDGKPLVGPTLKGVFGRDAELEDGATAKIDGDYLRESLLRPHAKVVKGYTPAMPTYQGKFDENELAGLIEYLKTLR